MAARGDLHTTVAIGYVRSDDNRIELDADLRVREAISAVFSQFAKEGSVRQVLVWFRQEHIKLPFAVYEAGRRSVQWKLPTYNTVLHILTNPVYAGAYAFGRTETRVRIEDGCKHVVRGLRRQREQWQVLILDHHERYIDWTTYEHNQRVIADNTNMRGGMAKGALRRGEALVAGLLRCGHCGRKLHEPTVEDVEVIPRAISARVHWPTMECPTGVFPSDRCVLIKRLLRRFWLS